VTISSQQRPNRLDAIGIFSLLIVPPARHTRKSQQPHGSFGKWLDQHHPLELAEWAKLFKKSFVFTGGEIVREFLLSTGYLPGAHDADYPIFRKVKKRKPAWMRA
jgi:DNA-3-methyladenine glycosylase I